MFDFASIDFSQRRFTLLAIGRACRLGIAAISIALSPLLTGCVDPLVVDGPQHWDMAVAHCISDCSARRQDCQRNAHADYHQCEAGYAETFRDYRWCLASSAESCGYPWWSCAENLHGYCANRYQECRLACAEPKR